MALEEGTEMGLVLEAELVRYFLDGEGCGTKERFGTLGEGLLDAGAGSHAKRFFDGIGNITGGETKLFGVPVEIVVLIAIEINQVHEPSCDFFVAGHRFVIPHLKIFPREEMEERPHQIDRRRAILILNQLLKQIEIVHRSLEFLRAHLPMRAYIDMGDESKRELGIDFLEEFTRKRQDSHFDMILRIIGFFYQKIGRNEKTLIRFDSIWLIIHNDPQFTF